MYGEPDVKKFMTLPLEEELQKHVTAFLDATGNEALRRVVCVVCARELMAKQCTYSTLSCGQKKSMNDML